MLSPARCDLETRPDPLKCAAPRRMTRPMTIDYNQAREMMVEQQVRPWDVLDPRVLDVLATLPREDFVARGPPHRWPTPTWRCRWGTARR